MNFRNQERGSMSLLPMFIIFAISALGIFEYLSVSQNVLGRLDSKREAEQTIYNVANRLTNLLAVQTGASCNPTIMSFIKKMRSFQTTNIAGFALNYNVVSGGNGIDCVLLPDERASISTLRISMVPVVSPNDMSQMSRTIKLSVSGQGSRFSSNVSVERLLKVRVSTLAQHALVLFGQNSKNSILVDDSASLEVVGTTFVAIEGKKDRFDYGTFVQNRSLPYDGLVVFKKTVYTNAPYAYTGATGFLQKHMAVVFTGGLQTNYLNDVPLPIFPSNASIYAGVDSAWKTDLDYEYVYNNSMAPLPFVSSGRSQNDDVHRYNSSGAVRKIPDANTTLNVSSTCRSLDDDQGSVGTMVVLQKNQNFVIDFSASSEPATGNDAFCGLIMAKQLTVKLRGDATIFGHFIIEKLRVIGTGKLMVVDPEVPSDVQLPAVGHGFDLLRRQLMALQIFIGQPFYVPLAYDPSTTFKGFEDSFVPRSPTSFLESCGAGRYCWPFQIQSPIRTTTSKPDIQKLYESGLGATNLVYTVETLL